MSEARSGARSGAGRGWRRWLAIGAVLAVAAVVVPDSAVKSTEILLVKADTAGAIDLSPDVVWILAVGSDARPGEDMTHTRGDALQLIGMNTKTGAATAIGIPRDSWVDIPGHGNEKINAALYFGGPKLLGQTVGNLVGIQPDYVFVTRFLFFQDMINGIGGIDVHNPVRFTDDAIHPAQYPDGFPAGKIHLNGWSALAFSRMRHYLPRGDFDRSANQQRVLRGIQSTVHAKAHVPGFIERGVISVMSHMYTDLGPVELFRLGQAMAHVDPRKVTSCVVQGGIGDVNGASVVLPYVDQARRLGDDARKDAVITHC